ncbi:unnamed protein product [Arctia plantaginis]|uniref:Gag protein n=1 Tax=Arctia plantaginis TaxID=874455 RepID=A0A8S0ZR35_ARCPL|nr:unnamed protein product [Arctia plantaginis]
MPTKSTTAVFREAVRGIVTLLRIGEDLVSPEPKGSPDEFHARFPKLDSYKDKLDTAFKDILESTDLTDEQEKDYTKKHTEATDYYTRILVIEYKLRAVASTSAQPSSKPCAPAMVLPKIELPKFSSLVEDWPSFIAIFKSLTDDMATLTDAVKLHYLLSSLSGEALSMVSHLKIMDENYPVALDILTKRFENRRVLIDRFVDIILGLPTINARSEIRRSFLTPLVSALSNLKNLALPMNDSDYIFVSILVRKMKGELRTLFERKHGSCQALPTLNDLVSFLEEHARCVENERSAPAPAQSPQYQRYVPAQPTRSRHPPYQTFRPISQPMRSGHARQPEPQVLRPAYHATPGSRSPVPVNFAPVRRSPSPRLNYCPYCETTGHRLMSCSEFLNLPDQGRWDFIEASGRCCRCLGPHSEVECRSSGACQHCGSYQHHTVLHCQDEVPPARRSPARRRPQRPAQRPPNRPQHNPTNVAQANPPQRTSSPPGSRPPGRASQRSRHQSQ